MTVKDFIRNDSINIARKLSEINKNELSSDIKGFGLKLKVERLIEDIKPVLFPSIYETNLSENHVLSVAISEKLNHIAITLFSLTKEILEDVCEKQNGKDDCKECERRATEITVEFLNELPNMRKTLSTDIVSAYNGDPAARFIEEIILCYPSIEAVMIYRLAHILFNLSVPFIPRIMTEYGHKTTGIDIHPGATIGEGFFIDHGTGVVIGETCTIGKNVKLYQGVTLGAKSFKLDDTGNPVKGIKRHPDIEDDVIIYSGATILGGDTVIGKGSVIGGNVWLVSSVPKNSFITNKKDV